MEQPPPADAMDAANNDEYVAPDVENQNSVPPFENAPLLRRQSSNFREYRNNISAMEREISIAITKNWTLNLIKISITLLVCFASMSTAFRTNNQYSLNHWKLNKMYLGLAIQAYILLIFV